VRRALLTSAIGTAMAMIAPVFGSDYDLCARPLGGAGGVKI
jgi:hypothetical protein